MAKKKYQAGLIAEVKALQMEVDLADSRNNLLSAQGALGRAENAFKRFIGLELSDSVAVQTDFDYQKIEIDQDEAIRLALANRTEIRNVHIRAGAVDVRHNQEAFAHQLFGPFGKTRPGGEKCG